MPETLSYNLLFHQYANYNQHVYIDSVDAAIVVSHGQPIISLATASQP